MSVSADEASRMLPALIDRIATSHHAVEIVSSNGRAVLMPADEYASWQETAYLFRSTKNARRLLYAYERALTGSRART
ncbi:type II toxin-antitoxin system Phd/YefM family antitoxin [Actinomyces sp. oral taxon 175]|uniref:type II toxin-antitoxin system Phd/YefM family antitoxin n=1 Tax=Actinomyces sp. oral taxon 175 TaxID=712119 RepID=UPI00021D3512|nr:type II toxin-antitoxin system prevent-host-death family antitoxin [Actinomyces sp. oral taxon 175]EGV13631.1 prevent-host-death family protein [Actinomyces sp. oral taxon 175 str. F0384]